MVCSSWGYGGLGCVYHINALPETKSFAMPSQPEEIYTAKRWGARIQGFYRYEQGRMVEDKTTSGFTILLPRLFQYAQRRYSMPGRAGSTMQYRRRHEGGRMLKGPLNGPMKWDGSTASDP
jgi:hypothetical protein